MTQTEIPEVPPVGTLKRLRSVLRLAEGIIIAAKSADVQELDGRGVVSKEEARAVAIRRRAIDKRIDALGMQRKHVRNAADFPSGTRFAAEAGPEFWNALEAAMTVVAAVHSAEVAAIPRRRP